MDKKLECIVELDRVVRTKNTICIAQTLLMKKHRGCGSLHHRLCKAYDKMRTASQYRRSHQIRYTKTCLQLAMEEKYLLYMVIQIPIIPSSNLVGAKITYAEAWITYEALLHFRVLGLAWSQDH